MNKVFHVKTFFDAIFQNKHFLYCKTAENVLPIYHTQMSKRRKGVGVKEQQRHYMGPTRVGITMTIMLIIIKEKMNDYMFNNHLRSCNEI